MTPERRNECMDRLEEISSQLAALENDLWDAELDRDFDDDDAEEDCGDIRQSIYELTEERDELLQEFPEIKYWPKPKSKRRKSTSPKRKELDHGHNSHNAGRPRSRSRPVSTSGG